MTLKWRRIDPASQPDLFGGVGIQRPETTSQADSLKQARQEMRDNGSDDLFDAEASTQVLTCQDCGQTISTGLFCLACWKTRAGDLYPLATQVTRSVISKPRTPKSQRWTDQAGTEHARSGGSMFYHKASCGVVGLQSTNPAIRACDKCQ